MSDFSNQGTPTPTPPSGQPYQAPPVMPPPVYQPPQRVEEHDPMSIWDYIWPGLVASFVPVVGWIIWLVVIIRWAFGANSGTSRKNYGRAQLIIGLIGIVVAIIAFIIVAYTGFTFSQVYPYY